MEQVMPELMAVNEAELDKLAKMMRWTTLPLNNPFGGQGYSLQRQDHDPQQGPVF